MWRLTVLVIAAQALHAPPRAPRAPIRARPTMSFFSGMLGGNRDEAPPLDDRAPTWDALRAKLSSLQTPEEQQAASVRDAGRGPPSAAADVRLFDAPDGTEPRTPNARGFGLSARAEDFEHRGCVCVVPWRVVDLAASAASKDVEECRLFYVSLPHTNWNVQNIESTDRSQHSKASKTVYGQH